MSLVYLPIISGIFFAIPDKNIKDNLKIQGMSLVIAEDDIAAIGKIR
jgi:hypothetical protein